MRQKDLMNSRRQRLQEQKKKRDELRSRLSETIKNGEDVEVLFEENNGHPSPIVRDVERSYKKLQSELTILNRLIDKAKKKGRGGCSRCTARAINSMRNSVNATKKKLGLPTDDTPNI